MLYLDVLYLVYFILLVSLFIIAVYNLVRKNFKNVLIAFINIVIVLIIFKMGLLEFNHYNLTSSNFISMLMLSIY